MYLFFLIKNAGVLVGGGVGISVSLSHCSKPQQEVHQTPKPCQSTESVLYTTYIMFIVGYCWTSIYKL